MTDRAHTEMELIDVLSRDGHVVSVCEAEERALGLGAGAAPGGPWAAIYSLGARERLQELFVAPSPGPHVVGLDLRRADQGPLPTTAVVTRFDHPGHGPCLRTVKWPRGGALDDLARLSEEKEILSSILAASDDAGWCMEWAEPVDLSAPEQEIIRQVFENGARWRFCNDAMARLYHTPEGEDFNARPVHEVFVRNPENEDFVRRLVRASFDVNASPSRDLRYDGVYIEVENDVRGLIRGNLLYRMWGTVRDVSKHARRAAVLREEIDTLEAILGAMPDAVLVADSEGRVLRINAVTENLLGMTAESVAGRDLGSLVHLPMPLADFFRTPGDEAPGHLARIYPATLLNPEGAIRSELTFRVLTLRGTDYLVLALRARLGPAHLGDGRAGPSRLSAGR